MTAIIQIDPDGTVTAHENRDVHELAHEMFNGTVTVVSLGHAPPEAGGLPLTAYIHDFGVQLGLPINVKVWAMYGRSPIVGPALIVHDGGAQRPALLPQFMVRMGGDYPPADVITAMRVWLDRNAAEHGPTYVRPPGL